MSCTGWYNNKNRATKNLRCENPQSLMYMCTCSCVCVFCISAITMVLMLCILLAPGIPYLTLYQKVQRLTRGSVPDNEIWTYAKLPDIQYFHIVQFRVDFRQPELTHISQCHSWHSLLGQSFRHDVGITWVKVNSGLPYRDLGLILHGHAMIYGYIVCPWCVTRLWFSLWSQKKICYCARYSIKPPPLPKKKNTSKFEVSPVIMS